MTETTGAAIPTDAELAAYLDGELSPTDSVRVGQQLASDGALAARLQHLMRGGRPFRDAFAPLLDEAPTARLTAMLDLTHARPAPRRWPVSPGGRAAVAAGVVALLAVGAAFDRLLPPPLGHGHIASVVGGDDADDWRRAVARYLSLYTADTLATMPDGAAGAGALTAVGDRIGLDLAPARVELPGLPLKRADIYAYDGKPLALLAYLDPQAGPLALCITEGAGGSDAQRIERRNGMTVVYWSAGRHRFMLIGHGASERLQSLAVTLADRFDAEAPRTPRHGAASPG